MSKKKTQRFLALALAAVLSVSMLACGGEQPDSDGGDTGVENADIINDGWFPIVDEQITITVAGQNTGTVDWNETDMVGVIASEMGIVMDCTQYESEVWDIQLPLMLSSDELPDLVIGGFTPLADIAEYGEDGYLLPIDEYLDYAPNLKAVLEEYPEYKALITTSDGHIYGLPKLGFSELETVDRVWIDRTWLENVNMDYPETVDELYEVLKAFKEQDANGNGDPDDEIPMSAAAGSALFSVLMSAFGLEVSDADINYGCIVNDDGTLSSVQTTENYQAYLEYMNKLYAEGLLDEVAFTQSADDVTSKVREGKVGSFASPAPYVTLGTSSDADLNYYSLLGLASEYNPDGMIVVPAAVSDNALVYVSADTEYPEAIVRLIDYFYTEEGWKFAGYGTEKSVEYLDFGTYSSYTAVLPEGEEENYGSAEEYRYKKAIINEALKIVTYKSGRAEYYTSKEDAADFTEEDLADGCYVALIGMRFAEVEFADAIPTLFYLSEDQERRATLLSDIGSYTSQAAAQFIVGEMDALADWDSYLATLEQMGLSELMAIEQNAYDSMFGS